MVTRFDMQQLIQELNQIIETYAAQFNAIADSDFSAKPNPLKWSKKEVLGHLIDSAQSNLRRFVCGQYELSPPNITYDQNFWVTANDYEHAPKEDVILLWKLINRRIAAILKNMPPENYDRECDTGKQSVQLHTLAWLADDYVRHMKHHLNQIIPS